MAMSLMMRVDEPKLEMIYSWLQQHQGSSAQLFGWDGDKRAALIAYGNGPGDAFAWADWVTKIADDPSTLLPVFDRLELITEDAIGSTLNATFLGAFTITQEEVSHVGQ